MKMENYWGMLTLCYKKKIINKYTKFFEGHSHCTAPKILDS